jgi:hypothetical protein
MLAQRLTCNIQNLRGKLENPYRAPILLSPAETQSQYGSSTVERTLLPFENFKNHLICIHLIHMRKTLHSIFFLLSLFFCLSDYANLILKIFMKIFFNHILKIVHLNFLISFHCLFLLFIMFFTYLIKIFFVLICCNCYSCCAGKGSPEL